MYTQYLIFSVTLHAIQNLSGIAIFAVIQLFCPPVDKDLLFPYQLQHRSHLCSESIDILDMQNTHICVRVGPVITILMAASM
jgi:hypothetical protein